MYAFSSSFSAYPAWSLPSAMFMGFTAHSVLHPHSHIFLCFALFCFVSFEKKNRKAVNQSKKKQKVKKKKRER